MFKTYFHIGDGARRPIDPPRDTAHRMYRALKDIEQAEVRLARARDNVPGEIGPYQTIDFYGEEQETLNRAIDRFEEAVVASVTERRA